MTHTRLELLKLCKKREIKGYSKLNKHELVALLFPEGLDSPDKGLDSPKTTKKDMGQFYTTNCDYILDQLEIPCQTPNFKIIEPFAGNLDLVKWASSKYPDRVQYELYDIDPANEGIIQRDTLLNPPDYTGSYVLTNPPFLARNKSKNKTLFDKYSTNDLYKCFIRSLISKQCLGGILIIPAGFFFSSRYIDESLRAKFMMTYKVLHVRYFEETVFEDTPTTVVAFSFKLLENARSSYPVKWTRMPADETRVFEMARDNLWIVGGEIHNLYHDKQNIKVRRHVSGLELANGEQQTFMTLYALDSGTASGRIRLEYRKDYVYESKSSGRTFATLRVLGLTKKLSENQQLVICDKFNKFIEEKRAETWSLFLPQFRESNEYARKRIPFELAYRIVESLILDL